MLESTVWPTIDQEPASPESVSPPASVLGKAELLFAAFDGSRPTLGLTDLSRRAGIPKATAHRLAQELVRLEFLERVEDGYQLGWRMFELGQLVPGPSNLRHIARPALIDLYAATRTVLHLAVPHGFDSVYLDRLAGRRDMSVHTSVGSRIPMPFTASGKLFLAFKQDPEPILGMLERGELDARTRHSFRTATQLRDQLPIIRERRWSGEFEECVTGYKTYSVPITASGPHQVVGAVSAALTLDRRDDRQVIGSLWAAAADISRSLRASILHAVRVSGR